MTDADCKARPTMSVHFSSKTDNWATPRDFFDAVNAEFSLPWDVSASSENAKLPLYWTRDQDGLAADWAGKRVWMNPPYGSQIGRWVEKAATGGSEIAVCLLPARTDTRWFHRHIYGNPRAEIRFVKGRLKFGGAANSAPLHGPPGTGKTTLARAIAATAKVPLIATSYSDWTRGGRYGVDIIVAMRATFAKARQHAPCVVAIDELDSIPARSTLSSEHVSTRAIVNALLEQLDGLNRRPGMVVIGACNYHDRLDEALIRSGRLGRSILAPLPALDALPQILAFHLADNAASIGDLPAIAIMCVGMTGADIENLVRDARQRARRASRPIRRDDLIFILEAQSKSRDPETERRIAVHEAGHAVAGLRLGFSTNVNVSIVGAADLGGRVAAHAARDP